MRQSVLAVIIMAAPFAAFGQSGRTYSSPGGFGNVIYPGTGHAPNAPTGTPRGYGRSYYGAPTYAPRVNHPAHGRASVVPYPVIVGGYGYGGYGYGYDAPPAQGGYPDGGGGPGVVNTNGVPSVVINQTFIPERAVPMDAYPPDNPQQSGMHVYEGLRTGPQGQQARVADDQPTIYLIAFKDQRIVPALGYWVEQGNLHYVSTEHSLNVASLDLIDRDMSQRLNDERNVEFRLPRGL